MENTHSTKAPVNIPNTLTLYRELFNHLELSAFNPSELLDLAALSAEQAEGLCHELMLFGHLLQKTPRLDAEGWEQLNRYLSATAHLVPALCNLYGRALRKMEACG